MVVPHPRYNGESTNGTSWTNISGATNSTLSVSATTALNNRQYRAVWTNSGGSVNSNSATLTVNAIPAAPTVSVVNNCGSSTLTAGSFTGSLLWSTGATSTSITVTTAGTYTVTQSVNGCTSPTGSGTRSINSNVPRQLYQWLITAAVQCLPQVHLSFIT
jgi:hypothetical protein